MSEVSEIRLPLQTKNLIKAFSNFSDYVEVMPSGRSYISYRKYDGFYAKCAVEFWLGIKSHTRVTLSMSQLLKGKIVNHPVDEFRDPSWTVLTGNRIKGKPSVSFELDSFSVKFLKLPVDEHERRIVRIDEDRPSECVTIEDANLSFVSIPAFSGRSGEFVFHRALRWYLPNGDYWVKLFAQGVASFENADKGFTFLTEMGDLYPLSPYPIPSN